MKQKKVYDDDDGRTVTDMNVPGMPWFKDAVPKRDKKRRPGEKEKSVDELYTNAADYDGLSERERKSVVANSILAGVVIALAFGGGIAVFILILTLLWK